MELRLRGGDNQWNEVAVLGPQHRSYTDEVPVVPERGDLPHFYFYKVRALYEGTAIESNRDEARMYGDPPGRPDTLRPRGGIDTLNPELSWRGGGLSSSFDLSPNVAVTVTP